METQGRAFGAEWFIAPAGPVDAAEILVLQRLAYQTEARLYGDWHIEPLTQTLEDLAASFDTHTILKAVQVGRIIGSVRASTREQVCRIGRLMVHPDCQSRGIGVALMAAIEAAFPVVARYELFTGHRSDKNPRLYGRLGYSEVRRERVSDAVMLVFLDKAPCGQGVSRDSRMPPRTRNHG